MEYGTPLHTTSFLVSSTLLCPFSNDTPLCFNAFSNAQIKILDEQNTYQENGSASSKGNLISLEESTHYNQNDNDYSVWSRPVNSYLMENEDGTLTRIEYDAYDTQTLKLDTYSYTGEKQSEKTLTMELPLFGGFFGGEKYNFLVFGQTNEEESDAVEVLRVVKYSKNWKRLSAASIKGADTYQPFKGGSLRMEEYGNTLCIHTCHTMYASSDGYNHQANMTIEFNQESMEEIQPWHEVMDQSYGYVSHSFNQFIKADESHAYRVDHGDAYPRGITFTRYVAGGNITDSEFTTLVEFPGNIGDNTTGASIGGMELSDDNCLIVGNTVRPNGSLNEKRNIFILSAEKQMTTAKQRLLTNYSADTNITVGTPQLVKFNSDGFLVMWTESANGKCVTKIQTCNGDGQTTSDVYTSPMMLSDCQPIVDRNGMINWYVNTSDGSFLYRIDPYKLEETENLCCITHKWKAASCTKAKTCTVCSTTKGAALGHLIEEQITPAAPGADGKIAEKCTRCQKTSKTTVIAAPSKIKASNCVYDGTAKKTAVTVYDSEGSKIAASHYTVSYSKNKEIGSASVKVTFKSSSYKGTLSGSFNIVPDKTVLKSISNTSSGVKISWNAVSKAHGYLVYRKTAETGWKRIQMTNSDSVLNYTDKTAEAGKTYIYTVKAYVKKNETYYYGSYDTVERQSFV